MNSAAVLVAADLASAFRAVKHPRSLDAPTVDAEDGPLFRRAALHARLQRED
jgi:hypothetical protein